MNTMDINGCQAVISNDPDISQFREEFVELKGGADFHAADVDALRQEGEISLRVFLKCVEKKASNRVGVFLENSMYEFHRYCTHVLPWKPPPAIKV